MASTIESAISELDVLVTESGTGTGKTFAYLVPALLSGKKVVVSTGTKHLQEQLFHRDLPVVLTALGLTLSTALLKGRANYLCLYRLHRNDLVDRFQSGEVSSTLTRIRSWAVHTRSGDIAEAEGVAEDAAIWPQVTSTTENCLGSQCEDYDKCFVAKARRNALEADVVVVNHHLFFADLVLREEGFGQLLPAAEAVVFDEAHQLPEIATQFFGQNVSHQQLKGLCRDIVVEEAREQSAVKGLPEGVRTLEKAVADFRLALGPAGRRLSWKQLASRTVFNAMKTLQKELGVLLDKLEIAATHGEGLAQCYRRADALLNRLYEVTDADSQDHLSWIETDKYGFRLHVTPLNVARDFRPVMDAMPRAWIFISATLAVNGDFSLFCRQLGLEDARTGCWDSPFDYAQQGLMFFPASMPLPSDPAYISSMLEYAIPVIEASQGRAFVLFTSYRALNEAARILADRLDYPLLIQGSAPRTDLLASFRKAGNAVLLGTGSFWEGVDVQGEALSCVIIDKLPFAAPDDPVLRARCEAMEQAGENPFMYYQVPVAIIALKQGVGRLIRDEQDRGVLMICDPRLHSKGYGKKFLASLPPMTRTRELAEVEEFFSS
ncbi:MAG: ATP-dependent DNA helicase [Gammaproteobacteria bacterium]|nr:MAG: ATP-dependent DNA helicase [Gammaproteobacteria bacterium]